MSDTQPIRACDTCRHWSYDGYDPEQGSAIGTCRRRAPQRINADIGTVMTPGSGRVWPTTWSDDWCGEYETDRTDTGAPA